MTTRASRHSSTTSIQTQVADDERKPPVNATSSSSSSTRSKRGSTVPTTNTPPPTADVKYEPDETQQSEDDDDDQDDEDGMSDGAEESAPAGRAFPAMSPPSLLHQASLALPASTVMQSHMHAGVGGIPTTITPPTNIARYSTMGPHGSYVAPPTAFSRQLSRLPSTAGGPPGMFDNKEWRVSVAVEERINIRRKLREAYFKHCPTYEQLLDTVVAVDEELLFACSMNRIDYFKSSIDWDSRIQLKRQQLKGATTSGGVANADSKKRPADDLSTTSVSLLEVGINNSDLVQPAAASSTAGVLHLPPVSQLTSGMPPKSPSKEEQPNKKQRSS